MCGSDLQKACPTVKEFLVSNTSEQRQQAVDAAIARMKSAMGEALPTRASLATVKQLLEGLAARRDLWQGGDFLRPKRANTRRAT